MYKGNPPSEGAWKVIRLGAQLPRRGGYLYERLIAAVNKEGFPELDLPPGLVITIDPYCFLMLRGKKIINPEGNAVLLYRHQELTNEDKFGGEVRCYFKYGGADERGGYSDEHEFKEEDCIDKASLKEAILKFAEEKNLKNLAVKREKQSYIKEEKGDKGR